MKFNSELCILFYIIIICITKCFSDSIDDSEMYCSTDPEGSCSLPSNNNISNLFPGIKKVFTGIYSNYADKIKTISDAKDKKRDAEFAIQEDLGIEKIDSSNYQKLNNGTWLVQIYSPWCPYSIQFQKTWKSVVKDVRSINELILSLDDEKDSSEKSSETIDKDSSEKSSESIDKDKEKDKTKEDELKIKKRLIMKDLKFAQINAYESIDVAALLEVKGFPTIKMLHKGNAVTYTNSTSHDSLVKFAIGEWMNQEWYNRLPKSPSKLYQIQLKLSLTFYKILYYMDVSIFIPFKYVTFLLFVYIAYNINILGKIRLGLNHVRQYFSAFVPEILDIE